MSVDLVFSGLRAGKIDLSRVDLDFFAGFVGKQAVDLDFFTVILDLSRVDLDFFAGFVGRRGGSKFGLREGKLAPFWRRGGGVSNEGLLDLMSVDLVFSGLRADISGKIDLSCVDLVFFWFAGFVGKQAVDLDFFAVSLSVRLVQANGTVDLVFFAVRLSVRLVQANGVVDLDFFAVSLSLRLVQANGVVNLDFFTEFYFVEGLYGIVSAKFSWT